MKTVKYFLVGALMTVISAPVMAQSDDIVSQATEIIKSKSEDADKQVKNLVKPFKKDAKTLAAVGRAYLGAKNFEQADIYADLAIKAAKNVAAGYVLKGDICVLKDDGGAASGWFEQAIYFDPKDPEGYRRYARSTARPTQRALSTSLRCFVPSTLLILLTSSLQKSSPVQVMLTLQ